MLLPSLILMPSPLLSSIARSSMVKSLALTSRPSAPEVWPLNERMVLSRTGAADGDAVHAQAQAAVEAEGAGRDIDDVAGLGVDQALLQDLLEIGVLGRLGDRGRVLATAGEPRRRDRDYQVLAHARLSRR